MTEKEVNEMFKDVELQFYSYNKYIFTFIGMKSMRYTVLASIGGTFGEIYKLSVERWKKLPFKSVRRWKSVVVKQNSQGGGSWEVFSYPK